MKKWGSLDVAGRAGQHRKPAAARIGRPTKQRSRNQNGCAARSADKNVGVAGLEARSTRAMKSSRAAKNLKGCNTQPNLSHYYFAEVGFAFQAFVRGADFGQRINGIHYRAELSAKDKFQD